MSTLIKIITTFIISFSVFFPAKGAIVYQTKALHPSIQTIRTRVFDKAYFPPVIRLDNDDQRIVSFDKFAEESEYLEYKIVHCNANWTPSDLSVMEYLDGFNQNRVEEGELSFNTFRHYVHYTITLPNESVRFKVSGNYVLIVFPENQPEKPLLQVCFSVFENRVTVPISITSRTDIDYNKSHQQLEFSILHPNYNIRNPQIDLKIYISQNNRLDNQTQINHPLYVKSNELVYAHNPNLIFEAGNEYRRFEMVSTRYAGINVESIQYFDPYYHVDLFPDRLRNQGNYVFDQTQYGHFTIRQSDADNSDVEADYFIVHFTLDYDNALIPGTIYIDGEFTNGQFNDQNKMVYNFETKQYEKALYLKQGSYNYQYLFIPHGTTKGTPANIEGNFYETKNEYLVKVYHRVPGERYDRLIGIGRAFSGE